MILSEIITILETMFSAKRCVTYCRQKKITCLTIWVRLWFKFSLKHVTDNFQCYLVMYCRLLLLSVKFFLDRKSKFKVTNCQTHFNRVLIHCGLLFHDVQYIPRLLHCSLVFAIVWKDDTCPNYLPFPFPLRLVFSPGNHK